jgi:hypothetical protein
VLSVLTGVEKSWRRFRDQLLVFDVKRATVEKPVETRPSSEEVPEPPLFVIK